MNNKSATVTTESFIAATGRIVQETRSAAKEALADRELTLYVEHSLQAVTIAAMAIGVNCGVFPDKNDAGFPEAFNAMFDACQPPELNEEDDEDSHGVIVLEVGQ